MRERTLLGGVILLCLLFLAGCRTMVPGERFDTDSLSKAQEIVIHDASGTEKAVLTEKADIDAFIDAVSVEGWRLAELPEDLTEAGFFTLWQAGTAAALPDGLELETNEICTLRIYEDGDYLTIETFLIDFTFSVPDQAAAYLRSLTA